MKSLLGLFWALILLPSFFGCGRLVYRPNQTAAIPPQQQAVIAQQQQQFQQRALALDRNNQELESLLAQSRQQTQLLEDQVAATREQLRSTNDQLLAARTENDQLRNRTTALAASVRTRSGATIRANNSLMKNLTIQEIPGVELRQDGDVIRVEIAGEQLFLTGSPYLKKGAETLVHTIAADLHRAYPNNYIGIEGHTDSGPTRSQQFPSGHHLSVARALSVYGVLATSRTVPPQQLFVVGHGANHPLVSNATTAGKSKNGRVELVVYPETLGRR